MEVINFRENSFKAYYFQHNKNVAKLHMFMEIYTTHKISKFSIKNKFFTRNCPQIDIHVKMNKIV